VERLNLVEMRDEQAGTVVAVDGGRGLQGKLAALGVLPGARVTKTSGLRLRGPVLVEVGGTQFAIGFGMACRVFVDVEESESDAGAPPGPPDPRGDRGARR